MRTPAHSGPQFPALGMLWTQTIFPGILGLLRGTPGATAGGVRAGDIYNL